MAPHHLHTVFTQNFCFIENKDFITSYGQPNDAAPTVLRFWPVTFLPPESLRDPEGLRTCRPDTGLVFTLNHLTLLIFYSDATSTIGASHS